MARPDVRIRIRGNVIRIRISEARIRTEMRMTAKQQPTRATNPCFHLFKIVSVTIPSQSHPSRELLHFPDFLQDVQNVSRTGEELLCSRFRAILFRLDFDKRLSACAFLLAELSLYILYEIEHPKCGVHQFGLCGFITIETSAILITWNFQKIQAAIIFRVFNIIIHTVYFIFF